MSKKKTSSYANQGQEYFWKPPRTNNQAVFLRLMDEKDWVFVQGPAGTGKTMLALQTALKALEMREIDKIYYVRNDPYVNKFGGKSLGTLPGEANDKLRYLLGPIQDNLQELCSPGKAKYLIDKGIIEPILFDQLRGRSFNYSFIIVDEAQNAPPEAILTAMTRKGKGSRMVFMGDSCQKDSVGKLEDGLEDAFGRLTNVESVGLLRFGLADVQRDEDLIEILRAYNFNYLKAV